MNKKFNEELKQTKLQNDQILKFAADGIFGLDNNGIITFINPAAEKMLGYTSHELLGQIQHNIIHNKKRDGSIYPISECPIYMSIKEKKLVESSNEIFWHKNGNPVIVEFTSAPVIENNSINGCVVIFRDITDKINNAEKLKNMNIKLEEMVIERTRQLQDLYKNIELEKKKLNNILFDAPAHIALTDGSNHIFTFVNENFSNLFNRSLIGKSIRESIPEFEEQGFFKILDEVYKSVEMCTNDEVLTLIDNKLNGILEEYYFNFIYKPMLDINNKIEGILIFAFDISDTVKSKKKIEEFAKALEISNKELNNFAYVASHDLKGPIRSIASYSELLQRRYKEKLDNKANDFLNLISASCKRLQNLIDDLLEHSKIISDTNNFNLVDLNKVMQEIIAHNKRYISDNNVVILYKNLPKVKINYNHIFRLFNNLITNSIKYKSDANPVIKIDCTKEDGHYIFSFKDNGIGINQKYSHKIFEIFQKLHKIDEYEGTGIGLANCKKIVELNNGKIWFESEEGDGTTFYFSLPA